MRKAIIHLVDDAGDSQRFIVDMPDGMKVGARFNIPPDHPWRAEFTLPDHESWRVVSRGPITTEGGAYVTVIVLHRIYKEPFLWRENSRVSMTSDGFIDVYAARLDRPGVQKLIDLLRTNHALMLHGPAMKTIIRISDVTGNDISFVTPMPDGIKVGDTFGDAERNDDGWQVESVAMTEDGDEPVRVVTLQQLRRAPMVERAED